MLFDSRIVEENFAGDDRVQILYIFTYLQSR